MKDATTVATKHHNNFLDKRIGDVLF